MKPAPPAKNRGRPRAFDAEEALEKAMHVFWHSGYEGASLPALTEAMGINRPSLYAVFGNKESLFRKAVDRYIALASKPLQAALQEPTARAAVERLLLCALPKPAACGGGGCMLVHGALACSPAADSVKQELITRRKAVEVTLRQRFERAVAEKDLAPGTDVAALAKFIVTFQNGLAVQSAGGATREELLSTVALALKALPAR